MKMMRMIRTLAAKFAALALVCGFAADALATPVAKVGSTEYETIDEAIAAWGPGKTLTLLDNVTYDQTVIVEVNATKSKQNWTLDLGDYTWTANSCNAFQLYAAGGTVMAQNYGLKVYANENGGIVAVGKYCIECKYDTSTAGYRPRLEIHGGTYEGNFIIYYYSSSWNNTSISNGPSTWFYKGNDGKDPIFNGNFGLFKCPVNIYAGVFNGTTFNTYPVNSTADTNLNGGSFKNLNALPSASNNKGIKFGSYVIFVDEEGRYNVVPTASVPADKEATTGKISSPLSGSYRFQNYTANIYWADADVAISNLGSLSTKTVTLNVNVAASQALSYTSGTYTIDASASGASYTGNVSLTGTSGSFTVKVKKDAGYYGNVKATRNGYRIHLTETETDGVVTRTYAVQSNTAITEANAEAQIVSGTTTNYYGSVYDAFFAVDGNTEGKTITLLKDVSNAGILTNGKAVNEAGKTVVTFDLNGHSFGLQSAGTGNDADYQLTVVDSSEEKTGKVTNDTFSLLKIALTGTGDYSGKYTLIVKGGKWRFNPEAIEYDGNTYDCVPNGFEVTTVVEDGITWYMVGEVPPRVAEIDGVYYETFADAIDAAEEYKEEHGEYPVIVVIDDTAEIGNPDWKIADGKLVHKVYIAQIGSAGYETLAAAFAAAVDGDTVTMLDNVTLTEPLNVTLGAKAVTLDLGGKTLAGRTNLKSGSLTIKNGTVAGGSAQALNVYGSATLAQNYSVLTIAATAKVTADVYGVCLFGPTYSSANGYGAVINIAGTVETTGDAESGAVFVSGNLGNYVEGDANNIINVTGSITSATDAAIALNGLATVNVLEGAEVVGNTAIAVKRGTLNVIGGTIRATGAKNYPPYVNNNGTEMTGAAISISDTYSQYGALAVAVSGGTVKSSNADALYMKDATYQSDASLVVSGGSFSTKVPVEFCATGLVPTTKPGANGLYTVTTPATVTYTLAGTEDDPATAALPDPASFAYPSGDLAEIALANATCTDAGYTFGGWQMAVGGTTRVVSALPAGTEGDVTLVATWTKATKIEIEIDVPTQQEPQATEKVEVKVTDEWVADNVTVDAHATEEEKAEAIVAALNAKQENDLTGLENYLLGLDGKDPNAKVVVQSEQGVSETAMPVKNTLAEKVQTADTGFTVKYSLDKVSSSASEATVEAVGEKQDTSDLELNLKEATSGDSNVAYYKMTATITKTVTTGENETTEVEVSTVQSENTIGVLAVKDAPATAIIGVPWSSSTDSTSISVDELVRTANLTPGDELKVYDPDTKTYKMWSLNDDKEWEPVATSSGSGTSDPGEAADNTVSRGAGVWLTRQNPDEPIYLVGQAEASITETAIDKPTAEEAEAGEKAWNLVASPNATTVTASDILKSRDDKVIIPTKGSPKNIFWNEKLKKWGYVDYQTDQNTGYSVPVFVEATATAAEIPAGTGFWYLNGESDEDKAKITW